MLRQLHSKVKFMEKELKKLLDTLENNLSIINENHDEIVGQFLDDYYASATAATRLHDVFANNIEGMKNYFQVGRQFWMYDDLQMKYVLITITYIRSGIVFYIAENDYMERSFGSGSVFAELLYPRVLYLKDVYNLTFQGDMSEKPPYEHLVAMYTTMKLDVPADYVKIDIEQ